MPDVARSPEREAATHRSDYVWRELAKKDPYWAVLSMPEYRADAMTSDARRRFFETGQEHVDHVIAKCRQLDPGFAPKSALDFGCGVGRLSLGLLRRGLAVTAVDIAPGMLALCRENAAQAGFRDIRFVASDDALSGVTAPVDLVVSTITFQHIHPGRGLGIFRRLLELLNPGGMFSIYFIFGEGRANGPVGYGNDAVEAEVEMNEYDLPALVSSIERHCDSCFFEFFRMGDSMGANLYGRTR